MSIFKCKMCGGTIEFEKGATIGVCEYCGTKQTLPHLDDEKRTQLFERANEYRRANEYDKAMGIYEIVLSEAQDDAEAYWSLVLCKYGIEYVEDPMSHKRIPTVNRTQFTSILDDANYNKALEYADSQQKELYEAEAKTIDNIQKNILEISSKEDPFDVFICYKESDENGRRTQDSVQAMELYKALEKENFKVFFSRVTLEEKLGTAFEPYIFAALNSAKVMVVIGSKPEYFNAVWVKNEWSRYVSLVRQDTTRTLIPAYFGMDPKYLPNEFSNLQAQDLSKVGAIQDIVRGIEKILGKDSIGKNTAETNIALKGLIESSYVEATRMMSSAKRKSEFLEASREFIKIKDYKDSQKLYDECLEKAEECQNRSNKKKRRICITIAVIIAVVMALLIFRKPIEYNVAVLLMKNGKNEEAIKVFSQIEDYKDSKDKLLVCNTNLEKQIQNYNEAVSLMNEGYYEAAMLKFQKMTAFKDTKELLKKCESEYLKEEEKHYNEAVELYNAGNYDEAKYAFQELKEFKDSLEWIEKCNIAINEERYQEAKTLYNQKKYSEAKNIFTSISNYEDSAMLLEKCNIAINEERYQEAKTLYNQKKYSEAKNIFKNLSDYADSIIMVEKCESGIIEEKYQEAKTLYNQKKYSEAKNIFKNLSDYADSIIMVEKCESGIIEEKYQEAVKLYNEGKNSEAKAAFENLGNYKDSVKKVEDSKLALIKSAKIGECVFIGSYATDKNQKYKEEIKWIVLAKENNKILVISEKGIECRSFNDSSNDITWETCSLRRWLNDTFYKNEFSDSEQKLILDTKVSADKNTQYGTKPGNTTTDKLFLLSISEAEKYFSSNEERICKPTQYAVDCGAFVNRNNQNCWWMLRTPGSDQKSVARIHSDGSICSDGFPVDRNDGCVRPAMWISTN